MSKIIKNWWDSASSYYQNIFNIPIDDIYYGPFFPTEKKLKIITGKDIKGKKILEVGCGGGQCSVFLSGKGAICSGIDISEKQIEYANRLAKEKNLKIDYLVGSGEDLSRFEDGEYDIALSVFAMQYVRNLDKCFREVSRILKNGGQFIFSIDHPFYSVVSLENMKIMGDYNYSGLNETIKTTDIISKKEWHDGDSKKFVFSFRRISDICKSLTRANLNIEEIKEIFSDKQVGPWDKIYSHKLSRLVPPTILFVVKKAVIDVNK